MISRSRSVIFPVLISFLLAPFHAFAQAQPPAPQQAMDQFVMRVRNGLKLNDEQVNELRQVLSRHEQKYLDLRRRAQINPYAPGLMPEIQKEQNAIRDEFAAFLDEDQKAKFTTVDTRLPVPLPPAFMVISIAPRSAPAEAAAPPLAARERQIQPPAPAAKGRIARLTDDQKILHLLNRATFGPRPGDVDRVRQMGIGGFLDEQLHPGTIDDSNLEERLAALPTMQMSSTEAFQFYPPPPVAEQRANEKNPPPVFGRPQQLYGELVQQKLARAVSSNRQLQEVMTDFWFNHFNVFAQKDADQWYMSSYERDVIRPRALGKFRDLLLATAESPAMLFYLDNWLSFASEAKEPRPPRPNPPFPGPTVKPASAPVSAAPKPNASIPPVTKPAVERTSEQAKPADSASKLEGVNAAIQTPKPPAAAPPKPAPQPQRKRDINENYARELMELHTLGVDGGYTQKDVQEVARCFTGWTIDRPYQGGAFAFRPWMHDSGSKIVLGVPIPAGGGMGDGLRVIDILSRHPSTARFISKKLCQRFVSDSPPPQLVERISQVFLRTDGEISEVLRAIFTSPEFNSPAVFRAKVKSPLELAASAIRALDGDTNGAPALHEWLRRMGEPLYQYAFPTGYGETSEKWVNTGVFFNRINFAVALAANQVNGTHFEPSHLVAPALPADEALNQLAALIVHTSLSPESRRLVLEALAQPVPPAAPRPAMETRPSTNGVLPVKGLVTSESSADARRLAQLIGLLLGTPEFQRR